MATSAGPKSGAWDLGAQGWWRRAGSETGYVVGAFCLANQSYTLSPEPHGSGSSAGHVCFQCLGNEGPIPAF